MTLKISQARQKWRDSIGHNLYRFILAVCSNYVFLWRRFWDITTFTEYVTNCDFKNSSNFDTIVTITLSDSCVNIYRS